MPEHDKIVNKPVKPEEVSSDPNHDEDLDFYNVVHKTEITLCSVTGNDLGDRVYSLYIEDQEGLPRPIGVTITVNADGSIFSVQPAEGLDALELLTFLKPELLEQYNREAKEENERKWEAKERSSA